MLLALVVSVVAELASPLTCPLDIAISVAPAAVNCPCAFTVNVVHS